MVGMSMREFLALISVFGVMAGESWFTWRVVLMATVGEELTLEELDRYREVAGRDPPTDVVQTLAVFVGRRGGKDSAAAVLVCYLALCVEWKLAAGEFGTVMTIAVDRDQAQVAFRRVLGVLEAVPVLNAKVENVTATAITLNNSIEIKVATADGAAVRGRTLVAGVLDEYAYMPHEAAIELMRALRPAMASMPRALIAIITTVYSSQGPAYELLREWGTDIPAQIVVKGTTRDFNPTISELFIERELKKDPQGASAEYLSIPRTDIARLFDAALLDAVTRSEPRELPRVGHIRGAKVHYFAGLDVSGGRGDAASASISHAEGERVVTDAVRRWPAPHDPVVVAGEVAAFLSEYGLKTARADQYAAEFATSVYREAGVTLQPSELSRTELYLYALPLFTTGRIEIPDDPMLRQELLALERRTARSGKDSIDHPPHGHDDVANAMVLAAYSARRLTIASSGVHVARSEVLAGAGIMASQSRAMEGF